MKHYVGLDVSMKETCICIEDENGKIVFQGSVDTDPVCIAEVLKQALVPIERVGVESGSISHWLTENLRQLEIPAICIDARKMATLLSVQVNKTDKNDARGIAQAMRCGLYREVKQKSQNAIEVGTLMGCRKLLVEQKVQTANAIRGFLKTYGIRLGATSDVNFVTKVRERLLDEYHMAKTSLGTLLKTYSSICEELKTLTKQVNDIAKDNETARRLMTIPGVGSITAMSYMAEIDDPLRFRNGRSVGAYLGMTPIQYSSGETKRQGRISKCGSAEVRCLLMEAATVLLTKSKAWSKLKAWGLKIQRKHGFKKAAMAVGRKLAVIMYRMWIDKIDFIYGNPDAKKQTLKASSKNTSAQIDDVCLRQNSPVESLHTLTKGLSEERVLCVSANA